MARFSVPSARLVMLVLGGTIFGMLLLDARADWWYWSGSPPAETDILFAAKYYHMINKPGSFVPRVIDACIAILGICGVVLLVSHYSPETPTHTPGSTSRSADMFNLLLFLLGAPYFILHVQPSLHRIVAAATEAENQKLQLTEILRSDLIVVAQGHAVLAIIVATVLVVSCTFMKRIDGDAKNHQQ